MSDKFLARKIEREKIYNKSFEAISDAILTKKIVSEQERCCFVVNEAEMVASIMDLKKSMPENSKHCFALKAFPIPAVLDIFKSNGFGQECATFEEVQIAIKANTDVKDIVFDSPCKTLHEIDWCFKNDIYLLNADSLEEVERCKIASQKYPDSKTMIGLRINPQIGLGNVKGSSNLALKATSTASSTSKFGIPLKELTIENFVECVKSLPAVQCLHVHVGSGGMGTDQLVEGCKHILTLAEEINNTLGTRQIKYLDVGGGFPIPQNYRDDLILFQEYWEKMKKLKNLEKYILITEHGRGLIHRAVTGLSRVEYVKQSGGCQIATIHLGENCYVFNCVSGQKIFPVFPKYLNSDGSAKDLKEEKRIYDQDSNFANKVHGINIVGPLCFSGDIVYKGEEVIPSLKYDDCILIPNSGAYSIAHYSKFNSISMPAVYIVKNDGTLECIKKKESIQKVVNFWWD